jgi:hypothetical protein
MSFIFDSRTFRDDAVRVAYRDWGFVVVRGVLHPQEVNTLRAELEAAFATPRLKDWRAMPTTECLKYADIFRVLFKDAVIGPLRAALGADLCYQNDMEVHRNFYGLDRWKPYSGWHVDAGNELGSPYLRSPDYRFAKCGVFLQDFNTGWGGGIRVKPKSHRHHFEQNDLKRWFFSLRRLIDVAALRLRVDIDTSYVPTMAGDLCFFDSRLLHSAAPIAREKIKTIQYEGKGDGKIFWPEIPRQHTKFVLYWNACNTAMSEDFFRNNVKRAADEKCGMTEQPPALTAAFTRTCALKYPEDYPAEFVASAQEHDIVVASLSSEQAASYKEKLQTMWLLEA